MQTATEIKANEQPSRISLFKKVVNGIGKGIAIKEMIFACSNHPAHQTYIYKRNLIRHVIIKNRSWISLMFWQRCKQKSKSVFTNQSWTGYLIIALMNTSRQTVMSIIGFVFPLSRTNITTIFCSVLGINVSV
jgi:hypothetical protein